MDALLIIGFILAVLLTAGLLRMAGPQDEAERKIDDENQIKYLRGEDK